MSLNHLQPELFIAVIKNSEGYLAVGSHKINQFDLEHKIEYGDMYSDGNFSFGVPGRVAHTEIRGEVNGFTTVQATTRLGAIGALIEELDRQEREEAAQKLEAIRKLEFRERFGGEVDDELIRKIVKWRKKQAEKQVYYDAYEENPDGY